MKTMTLLTLASLTFSQAFAQTDPVLEQINITKDAVAVALEEISKGGVQTASSEDAEQNIKAFSANASKVLKAFEEKVRIRVLQSMSVMVGQYNNTYHNKTLNKTAKNEILESLLKQIQVVAADKSQIYKQAYLELYSVFPDLPIQYDFKGKTSDYGSYKYLYDSYSTEREGAPWKRYDKYTYSYTGDVYLAKSGTKKLNYQVEDDNYYSNHAGAAALLKVTNTETPESARTKLLAGCYTSTCYFLMQSQYTIWKSMIESSLVRDISIKLEDGNVIKITKNVNRNGQSLFVLDTYLTNINIEGLINNLPHEISPERYSVLSRMDDLLAKDKCRSTKSLREELCTRTQEGCLKDSEVVLLQDRHGEKATCLGSKK